MAQRRIPTRAVYLHQRALMTGVCERLTDEELAELETETERGSADVSKEILAKLDPGQQQFLAELMQHGPGRMLVHGVVDLARAARREGDA
jgi:hypothetical protein